MTALESLWGCDTTEEGQKYFVLRFGQRRTATFLLRLDQVPIVAINMPHCESSSLVPAADLAIAFTDYG